MWSGKAMQYYELDTTPHYGPLPAGKTKLRKIAGVTVVQRHTWSKIRYKEIRWSLEGRPLEYWRHGDQLEMDFGTQRKHEAA